jgi:hypothetical protein
MKKSLKNLFGIGALVGIVALGSTLAASINLNNGGPVEFGQGVTQTISCDSGILVTPYSEFVNGDPGSFMFTALRLSQVDTTDQADSSEGCAGKSFLIKLYEEDGDRIQPDYTISVSSGGAFSSIDGNVSASNEDATDSSVTLTFNPATVLASELYRITIETSVGEEGGDEEGGGEEGGGGGGGTDPQQEYPTGGEGPTEGGVVFYYDSTGFDCGPTLTDTCYYLELAPADWDGSGSGSDPDHVWSVPGNQESEVPAFNGSTSTNRNVGAGLSNTLAIINQNGVYNATTNNYAAGAANAYRGGGFNTWNLPSRSEAEALRSVFDDLIEFGYAGGAEYWSSNQCGPAGAYKIGGGANPGQFYTGGCEGKSGLHPVRPVRAF